ICADSPVCFHASSLIFHCLTTLILFWFAYILFTGSLPRAFTVALIFSVHPLVVESVAWISARNHVLWPVFGLLAMVAYSQSLLTENVRRRYIWITLCWACYLCAL